MSVLGGASLSLKTTMLFPSIEVPKAALCKHLEFDSIQRSALASHSYDPAIWKWISRLPHCPPAISPSQRLILAINPTTKCPDTAGVWTVSTVDITITLDSGEPGPLQRRLIVYLNRPSFQLLVRVEVQQRKKSKTIAQHRPPVATGEKDPNSQKSLPRGGRRPHPNRTGDPDPAVERPGALSLWPSTPRIPSEI